MPQDPPADWVFARRRVIGHRIRTRRLWANLTQEQLGEAVRVDRRTISGWEYGTSDPTLTDLLLIARALDVDPAELIAGLPD